MKKSYQMLWLIDSSLKELLKPVQYQVPRLTHKELLKMIVLGELNFQCSRIKVWNN